MITYKNRDPSSDFEDKPVGNEECPLNLSFIRKVTLGRSYGMSQLREMWDTTHSF